MKTLGFVKSTKANEKRRACLPEDILKNVKNREYLYFEKGYGETVGVSDDEYKAIGCHVVTLEEVLNCDVITDVKIGDSDLIDEISEGKTLFGWAHTVQNVDFTSKMLNKNHTVIAWEEIFEGGRSVLYRNSEVAGEAAVMQAFQYCGKMPYDTKVAILGNGYVSKGAMRILHGLGAEVDVYGRKLEKLFMEKMFHRQ